MRTIRSLLWALPLVIAFAGIACSGTYTAVVVGCVQGNGISASEERKLEPFTAIKMDGAFDAHIVCGNPGQEKIRITTDKNLLDKVISEVRSGTLVLSVKGSVCTQVGMIVEVTADQFERLTSLGSGDIEISGIDNEKLQLTINGSANLSAEGKTDKLEATLNGSSDLQAADLHARQASVTVRGSGDVQVWASDLLEANITGVGDISYGGNPARVQRNITGVGDINPM